MYCTSCGALIDDDTRFCPHCGMPTAEIPKSEADYSGLTIDVETGRQLGETAISQEPTRLLNINQPQQDTAEEEYSDFEQTVIDSRRIYAQDYPQEYARDYPQDYTQDYPQSYAQDYPQEYAQDYSQQAPVANYQDLNGAPTYQSRRKRSNSTTAITITAAVAVLALIGIVLHFSGLAPWVRQTQTPEQAAESLDTTGNDEQTAESEDTSQSTQELVPIGLEQPQETGQDHTEAVQQETGSYILADSDTHTYTASELAGLSDWQLFIARNEIYARHGRLFRNTELQEYFNSQSWYRGTIAPDDFDESLLNDIERSNASTILQYEKDHNSSYL